MALDEDIVLRDVTNAGVVISDRIAREVATQLDLEEALEASRYASDPYTTHPREWPPLLEVVDTWELPPVLIERYNAAGGEGTALCGIFPEIRRAWASVDNSLFLWRFDKWDGQCPEFNVEEQAICAVGLTKSKPGVFVEAIQYLLILATPAEGVPEAKQKAAWKLHRGGAPAIQKRAIDGTWDHSCDAIMHEQKRWP